VAAVSLVLAAWVTYIAMDQMSQRCVADANGVDVWGLERVGWKDVASVTLVEERAGARTRRVGVLDRYRTAGQQKTILR
jgi:hypothetical protein